MFCLLCFRSHLGFEQDTQQGMKQWLIGMTMARRYELQETFQGFFPSLLTEGQSFRVVGGTRGGCERKSVRSRLYVQRT